MIEALVVDNATTIIKEPGLKQAMASYTFEENVSLEDYVRCVGSSVEAEEEDGSLISSRRNLHKEFVPHHA